jgi:uncharacterized membrane protein YhhN
MTPELPLGPHPSNAFAFVPGLPSFWLATLQCLYLDSRASFFLAHNLATSCLGREPKATVATKPLLLAFFLVAICELSTSFVWVSEV